MSRKPAAQLSSEQAIERKEYMRLAKQRSRRMRPPERDTRQNRKRPSRALEQRERRARIKAAMHNPQL